MANFEEAHHFIIESQGSPVNYLSGDEDFTILLCSNCFSDEGLRLDAYKIGIDNNLICPKCNSTTGHKLTKDLVLRLCYRFFVRGTIEKSEYGGFPLIQFNNQHFTKSEIKVSNWLESDVALIEQAGEIGFFYYGPRFWMFGEIEPLKSLQNDKERNHVIESILKLYPVREITSKDYFYRLRKDPKVSYDFSEFDTAPENCLGQNRFDNTNFPVLYGSPDLELCIHECRATVEDNLFVAKLVPAATLKMLDLSVLIDEDVTEFESLDMAIHFLFLAGKHSYPICKQIALHAKQQGYDGLIYPSYYSFIKTGAVPFDTIYGMSIRQIPELKEIAQSQSIPNLAIFGRPLKEQKVLVECINKVIINKVSYDTTFGPAFHEAFSEEDYMQNKTKAFKENLKSALRKNE